MSIYEESVLRPGGLEGLEGGIVEWTDGYGEGGGGGGKPKEVAGDVELKSKAFSRSFLIFFW